MAPVAQVCTASDGSTRLFLWCPACTRFGKAGGSLHQIVVAGGAVLWTWDGNLDAPTVSPSLLVKGFGYSREPEVGGPPVKPGPTVCHSFIVNGQWQFLGDCTHALAGQTVDLPPLPEWFLSNEDY